jgi:hypothetical protein
MKFLKYLSYVLRHKWFVLVECWRVGLYWRGLVHDLSKFTWLEFTAYADFFYGAKDAAKKAKRDATGYYKPTDTGDARFDFAWLQHQKRNDHHWQWWICPQDDGGFKLFEMSLPARIEMVCDWRGAGRAQGKVDVNGEPEIVLWYKTNKDKMLLAPETRHWVEMRLGLR